jgi:hypothetical protein
VEGGRRVKVERREEREGGGRRSREEGGGRREGEGETIPESPSTPTPTRQPSESSVIFVIHKSSSILSTIRLNLPK